MRWSSKLPPAAGRALLDAQLDANRSAEEAEAAVYRQERRVAELEAAAAAGARQAAASKMDFNSAALRAVELAEANAALQDQLRAARGDSGAVVAGLKVGAPASQRGAPERGSP